MVKLRIVQLTTVHPRCDTRIFLKQAQTLAANPQYDVWFVVADGKGGVDAAQGGVSICDVGRPAGGQQHASGCPDQAAHPLPRLFQQTQYSRSDVTHRR